MDSKKIPIAQLKKNRLKNILKTGDLFAIGYGDVGSSIYYALGLTALYSLGATPLSIALAGLVFICTSLTYAEMTSCITDSGGSATFARLAFNDLVSFIAGWGLFLDYLVTIAISAFAIPPYMKYCLQSLGIEWTLTTYSHVGITVFIIGILFLINFIGVEISTFISKIMSYITIVTQFVIIAMVAYFAFNFEQWFSQLRINIAGDPLSPNWANFLKGTAMAMVAYTGIESIAQLGSETKNPSRTMPRSILITMGILVILYLGISGVAVTAVSPHDLGTKYLDDPIAGIATALPFGKSFLTPWIGLIASLILFVAANAGLIGISRLSYKMSEYYQIPRHFYRSHPRFRTPYVSLGFFSILAVVIVLASRGKMLFLADLYNFGAMIAFFSAHLSLILLRIKKPKMNRPFKVPLNISIKGISIPLPALFGCLATFSVWVLVIITKPEGRVLGFSWLFIGLISYGLYRRKKKIPALANVALTHVSIPKFTHLQIKKVLVPTRGGSYTENVQIACQIAKQYKAEVYALHVIEVANSLPVDGYFPKKIAFSQGALERAEAIAREYEVPVHLFQIQARSVEEAIINWVEDLQGDLLVVGVRKGKRLSKDVVDHLLEKVPCRVWICQTEDRSFPIEKVAKVSLES